MGKDIKILAYIENASNDKTNQNSSVLSRKHIYQTVKATAYKNMPKVIRKYEKDNNPM